MLSGKASPKNGMHALAGTQLPNLIRVLSTTKENKALGRETHIKAAVRRMPSLTLGSSKQLVVVKADVEAGTPVSPYTKCILLSQQG